jgi:hypothetical protein
VQGFPRQTVLAWLGAALARGAQAAAKARCVGLARRGAAPPSKTLGMPIISFFFDFLLFFRLTSTASLPAGQHYFSP